MELLMSKQYNIFFFIKELIMARIGLNDRMIFYPMLGIGIMFLFLALLGMGKTKNVARLVFLLIAIYLFISLCVFFNTSFH